MNFQQQPICDTCWWDLHPEGRHPVRCYLNGDTSTYGCCICGETTESGIFVRLDTDRVPHPQTLI